MDAPADPVEAAEQRDLVLAALGRLNPDQRAALVLVDMQGYSVEEAATILGCAPGTVKSRCARGRAKLAPLLASCHLGEGGDPLGPPPRAQKHTGAREAASEAGAEVAHPLELSYNWRTPAFFATIGAFICAGAVIRGRVDGLGGARPPGGRALGGVPRRALPADPGVPAGRRGPADRTPVPRRSPRSRAKDVVAVAEYLTPNGPSYRLTVRGPDGRNRRLVAPVALLRDGRATLFAWILAEAPHAELDSSSRRTVEALQSKGMLP